MDTVLLVKIISALVYPIGFICVLILLRLLFWRSRLLAPLLSCLIVVVLLVSTSPIVANYLANSLEEQHPQQNIDDIVVHDAIIVLGGGIRLPSAPAKHTQIGSGTDRLWYAVRLYRADKAKKIILAGGNLFAQPGLRSEAYYARELLQEWGVPESAILVESISRNTQENKDKLETLLAESDITSALLVTSALHMPRAFPIINKLPIAVTPASADILVRDSYLPSVLKWLPSARALSLTTASLHEYYGIWFNQLKDILTEPATG